MTISKKQLKEFLSFHYLDVIFFLSIGFMFSPFATKDNQLVVSLCIFIIGVYLLAFLVKNLLFYAKKIYANKKFDFLALFFALNFLFLLAIFIFKSLLTSSLDFDRLFNFYEPSVVFFYAWGIVSILGIVLKDRYKSTANLLQTKN